MIQQKLIKALKQISLNPASYHIVQEIYNQSQIFFNTLLLIAKAPDSQYQLRQNALIILNAYIIKSINQIKRQKIKNSSRFLHQYYTQIDHFGNILQTILLDNQHLSMLSIKKKIISCYTNLIEFYYNSNSSNCFIVQEIYAKIIQSTQSSHHIFYLQTATFFINMILDSEIKLVQKFTIIKMAYKKYFSCVGLAFKDLYNQMQNIQKNLDLQREKGYFISMQDLKKTKQTFLNMQFKQKQNFRFQKLKVYLQTIQNVLNQFKNISENKKYIQKINKKNYQKDKQKNPAYLSLIKEQQKCKKIKTQVLILIIKNQHFTQLIHQILSVRFFVSFQQLNKYNNFLQTIDNLKISIMKILIVLMYKTDQRYNFQNSQSILIRSMPSILRFIVNDLVFYSKCCSQQISDQIKKQQFKIIQPNTKKQRQTTMQLLSYFYKFLKECVNKIQLYSYFHNLDAYHTIQILIPHFQITKQQVKYFKEDPCNFMNVLNYFRYEIENQLQQTQNLKINASQLLRKMKKIDGFITFFFNFCIQIILFKINAYKILQTQQNQSICHQIKYFLQERSKIENRKINLNTCSFVSALWGLTILCIDQNSKIFDSFINKMSKIQKNLLKQTLKLIIQTCKNLSQIEISYIFNFMKYHQIISDKKQLVPFIAYIFNLDSESQGLYTVVLDYFFDTILQLSYYNNKFIKQDNIQLQNKLQSQKKTKSLKRKFQEQMVQENQQQYQKKFKIIQNIKQIFDQLFLQKFLQYTFKTRSQQWFDKIIELLQYIKNSDGKIINFFYNPQNSQNKGIYQTSLLVKCLIQKISNQLLKQYPQEHFIVILLNTILQMSSSQILSTQSQRQIFDWLFSNRNQLFIKQLEEKYSKQLCQLLSYIILHDQCLPDEKKLIKKSLLGEISVKEKFNQNIFRLAINQYRKSVSEELSSFANYSTDKSYDKKRKLAFNIIGLCIDKSNYYNYQNSYTFNQTTQLKENNFSIKNIKQILKIICQSLQMYNLLNTKTETSQCLIDQNSKQIHDQDQDKQTWELKFVFIQKIISQALILLQLILIRQHQQINQLHQQFSNTFSFVSFNNYNDVLNHILCIISHCFIQSKKIHNLRPSNAIYLCGIYLWYSIFLPKNNYSPNSFHMKIEKLHKANILNEVFIFLECFKSEFNMLSASIYTIILLRLSFEINQMLHREVQLNQERQKVLFQRLQFLKKFLKPLTIILMDIHNRPKDFKLKEQTDQQLRQFVQNIHISINHNPKDSKQAKIDDNFRKSIDILNKNLKEGVVGNIIKDILKDGQDNIRQLYKIQSIIGLHGNQTRKILKIKK